MANLNLKNRTNGNDIVKLYINIFSKFSLTNGVSSGFKSEAIN